MSFMFLIDEIFAVIFKFSYFYALFRQFLMYFTCEYPILAGCDHNEKLHLTLKIWCRISKSNISVDFSDKDYR